MSECRVLVTGAGGFVGGALVEELLNSGYKVKALVRKNHQALQLHKIGAEPILGDILDIGSLTRALDGVSIVFHIAALFRQAGLPDSEYYKVNVVGTKNVLDCSLKARVKTFLHCSTNGVHANTKESPTTENTPFKPGDVYQLTKLKGEEVVFNALKSGVIRGSVIRPGMIYGKGDLRFLKLFKRIAEEKFFYIGRGDCLVHYLNVRDLARAFIQAAETEAANGHAFLVAGKTALPLNQFVSILCLLFGVREPSLHLPVVPMQILGDICETICTPLKIDPPIFRRRVDFFTKHRSFDCSKATRILKYQPQQGLIEELIEIIDDYVEKGLIKNKRNKSVDLEELRKILLPHDARLNDCKQLVTESS